MADPGNGGPEPVFRDSIMIRGMPPNVPAGYLCVAELFRPRT